MVALDSRASSGMGISMSKGGSDPCPDRNKVDHRYIKPLEPDTMRGLSVLGRGICALKPAVEIVVSSTAVDPIPSRDSSNRPTE